MQSDERKEARHSGEIHGTSEFTVITGSTASGDQEKLLALLFI